MTTTAIQNKINTVMNTRGRKQTLYSFVIVAPFFRVMFHESSKTVHTRGQTVTVEIFTLAMFIEIRSNPM